MKNTDVLPGSECEYPTTLFQYSASYKSTPPCRPGEVLESDVRSLIEYCPEKREHLNYRCMISLCVSALPA